MDAEEKYKRLVDEIRRRFSFVKDELIGQSPEDLKKHYTLIGKMDAFGGIVAVIKILDGDFVPKEKNR